MTARLSFDDGEWSNAAADRIELVEPDPEWPRRFVAEADAIRRCLSGVVNPWIEHVGSTAVPGIAAKPILDILLILPPETQWSAVVDPLESIDYVYWAENPRSDRMFFVKGMVPYGRGRTHHVHVRTPPEAEAMLRFRDYLIAHPNTAVVYENLKRELASRHPTDREAYTRGKDEFVKAVMIRATIHWTCDGSRSA